MARPIAEFRRPEIIQAFKRALMKCGLNLPSNDEIANEAGMSRQLIRHYFPKQPEMAHELAKALADEYQHLLSTTVIATGDVSRLKIFLDFYFGLTSGDLPQKPQDNQIYDALLALAATDLELQDILSGQYKLLSKVFSHEIHVAHPSLNFELCEELSDTIVSLMYGHWKMIDVVGFSAHHHVVAREAIDRLIHSYLKSPPVRHPMEGSTQLPVK
ncbi:MAG: TetR/AcrR family transcriptional regulator [Pseudomonadota bacterium]